MKPYAESWFFLKGPRITQLLPIGQTGNEDREELAPAKDGLCFLCSLLLKEVSAVRARWSPCGYAQFRSLSHRAVIRVYDDAGNVIETYEHKGDFKEP
jgi:hypothetical protein